MTSDEPIPGRCGAECSTGGYCENYPKGDADRCRMHGADGGAPAGNINASTHGAFIDENEFYRQKLGDAGRELVAEIFQDYVEEYRDRHGSPPTGLEAELFRVSVSHVKDIELDRWSHERPDDLDPGNGLVARETRYTETGKKYHEYKESVVLSAQKKLSNDRRKWLKDLGLLEDPESQKADAIESLDLGLTDAELEALEGSHADVDPDP